MSATTSSTLAGGANVRLGYRLRSLFPGNPAPPAAPRPAAGWFRPEAGEGGRPAPDLNVLLAHLPAIVVRFDRALRHVFVNAALERLSGRPAETFLGKTLREINTPGDFSAALETHLRQVFATGEERFFDHADPDGSRFMALHLTPEFADDGSRMVESVLVTSHDVTCHHRAEQERDQAFNELRRANERLLALDAEKSAFLGICSHDLRNPLADILMATELLRQAPEDAEMVTEVGGVAQRSAEFMLALVNNLLDLSAIEAGQFPLQPVALDVPALVATVVQAHQLRARNKGIVLYLVPPSAGSADPDELRAMADRHATVQILDNLVSNAVKFTPPGGTVNVHLERPVNGMIGVTVQDSGPGLSAADQAKLFGKFARLSTQPTGGERSSGLGLSIVKRLVESMLGRVWCESEPGAGATFRVELPAAVRAAESLPQQTV